MGVKLDRVVIGNKGEILTITVDDFNLNCTANHKECVLNWLYDIKYGKEAPITFDIEKHTVEKEVSKGDYWFVIIKGLKFNQQEMDYQVGSIRKMEDDTYKLSMTVSAEVGESYPCLDKAISRIIELGSEKVKLLTGARW